MIDTTARPIPKASYPCKYCSDDYTWPAVDLWWSDMDKAWVCDMCWGERDSAWNGEVYFDEERVISLEDEIERHKGEE